MVDATLTAEERLLVLKALDANPENVKKLETENIRLRELLTRITSNHLAVLNIDEGQPDDDSAFAVEYPDGQRISILTFGDLREAQSYLTTDD